MQRWGEPRLTQDVDLTLITGFGREEHFVDTMLARFPGRRSDARTLALQYRVLLLRTESGIPIDVALGAFPFEERSIARSSLCEWRTGASIRTCSAEDLVVHKYFAGRDRDWGDVERILVRQYGKLNLQLIRSELPPLLEIKEAADSLKRLERIIADVTERLKT